MRNAAPDAAVRAAVLRVSPAGAAEEHFGDVPDDAPSQQQDVFCPEREPSATAEEYLSYGDCPPDSLHTASIRCKPYASMKIAAKLLMFYIHIMISYSPDGTCGNCPFFR